MEALKAYVKKTEIMLELLDTPSKDRSETIEQINIAIEERERLSKDIKPPYTEDDKILGKHAVALEEQLNQELQVLFGTIKKDMRNVKQQSRSNKSYLNPYQHIASYDGKFLDSKK